jgi:hypothetical protein
MTFLVFCGVDLAVPGDLAVPVARHCDRAYMGTPSFVSQYMGMHNARTWPNLRGFALA